MKIGIMTGGGDCPGLNAVIRGVVLKALANGWEVLGIEDATEGLINLDYKSPHGNRMLGARDVEGILTRGGTILGTSNRSHPFKYVIERDGEKVETDISDQLVANYHKLGLDAVVSIGGDGSMDIAQQLGEKGMNMVGVPKTIDKDLAATDYTFGFNTAVQAATDGLDRLQDTAASHDRVMIMEVMGRGAGWIALHSAIAGGAHVCLLPEIPYKIQPVIDAIKKRQDNGAPFSIVVVAEGAKPADGQESLLGERALGEMPRLFGAGQRVAAAIQPHLDLDVRVTVLGHLQRGGSPTHFDRVLGSRFGVAAVECIEAKKFNHMVVLRTPNIVAIPIKDALAAPANVNPDGELVRSAESIGIEFGRG